MAIYAISDLHLARSIDKPMDIFGPKWANYMDRLEAQWRETVSGGDTVLVPGDISWATYLDEAYEDFKLLESLPGRKIISKGNHDYWWTTHSKLEKFLKDNGFDTISFMHNNSFLIEGFAVCGTRGWSLPGDEGFGAEDRKIYERELKRLELSLKSASSSRAGAGGTDPVGLIAALHFPPVNPKGVFSDFLDIMQKYEVSCCIYGHLHGEAHKNAFEGRMGGIEFRFVSADRLGFKPLKLT